MTSSKVVSLAERRREALGIQWRERSDAPVTRDRYDAWVETDGSLVMRIGAEYARYEKRAAEYGTENGPTVFKARGNAYEVRIPADVAKEWFDDMRRLGNVSRVTTETRRGMYDWRCTPNGDGTFTVKYAYRTAVFEAFRPKLRRAMVPNGVIHESNGYRFEGRKEAMVAPNCHVCRRVIQIGETAYREQRNPHGRAWPEAVICSDCIQKAPREGLTDVGGTP